VWSLLIVPDSFGRVLQANPSDLPGNDLNADRERMESRLGAGSPASASNRTRRHIASGRC
jgi:hypothetical protein